MGPRKNGRTACTEENELLNSNAIKMSDAPFGRSDSEDDIIEDYDDVVTFKGPCCKGRTPLERALLLLLALLLVIIIGLAVGLTRPRIIQQKEYCRSSQCVEAASSMLSALDQEAEPCTDFFQYACGGWARRNPIPKGYHHWDRIQELSGQNLYLLKGLIDSSSPLLNQAERKVRNFYRSCMAEKATSESRIRTLQRLQALVDQQGGWSTLQGRRAGAAANDSHQWFFTTTLQKLHRLGAWPLFKVTVDVDERDPTHRYILKMDLGETVLPADMYPPLESPSPAPSSPDSQPLPSEHHDKSEDDKASGPDDSHSDNGNINGGNDTDTEDSSNPSVTAFPPIPTTTTTTTTTTTENPQQAAMRVKRLFVEETVHILQSMGFNHSAAHQRASLMADLEHQIAAATEGKAHAHDRFSLYNVLTVAQLEANYSMFSWTMYFNTLGFSVTPETEVVVFHPGYMAKLTSLVTATSRSPQHLSVLRDYMVLTLVRSFKQYYDMGLFDMDNSEADWMEEGWKRCTFYTNRALGFATGAVYVRGMGQQGNVDNIQNLISYVRDAFKDYILHKYWINKETRLKAEQKVDSMINKISYPSYILNTTFLDSYYQKFVVNYTDWFTNLISWRHFTLQKQNEELHSTPDREKSWIRPPVTVNAFYSPIRNDIIFPIAMFHLPYYIPGGPVAVNFGAMGSVIGHEITHAFDIQGRQYDEEGRLKDWWDPESSKNFGITTSCMVDQYNNIKVQGRRVNGDFTLDENIADNGGLNAAYYAYMKWMEENEEEAPLPGMNLTNYQAFFVSYAQMYCSKWTDMGLRLHLLTDPHSPGAARVNGVLANSKTFSWAFQCPVFSKMNAQVRCKVW